MDKYTSALLGFGPPAGGLGIIDDVVDTASSIVSSITNSIYSDNVFIRYRDKVFAIIFANFPRSVYDPILAKYKLGHSDIPDRKIGKTYAEEFNRLHQAVAELLDTRKPGLGSVFLAKSTEFAQKYIAADPSRSYKGAPDEALSWVLANPNVLVQTSFPSPIVTSQPGGTSSATAPDTAEASFNVSAPNKRMLMIAGGVLVLGGITYMVTTAMKKKGVGEVKPAKKGKKRRK